MSACGLTLRPRKNEIHLSEIHLNTKIQLPGFCGQAAE